RQERKAEAGQARFADMLRYVGANWPVYVGIAMLVSVMTVTAYSQGWYAPMFERTWGWKGQTYAFWNGIVLLAVGPLTVNIAGYLSDKLYGMGRRDGPLLIVMMGVLILVPTAVLIPLMPGPKIAMALIGLNTVGIAMASATGATALLNVTPGQIRGQTVALYYMTISFAGMIGPLAVGFLSDRVFGEEGLRYAVAIVPLVVGVPAIALMLWVRRHYLARLV
ncbi:MAG: MFS transporter, partial [Gammaproteobacteria bacterium]